MTALINAYIGKPYKYGARGPDAFDCWGLVLALRAALGLPVPPDFSTRTMAVLEQRRLMFAALAPARLVDARHGAIAYSERHAHAGVFVHGRVVHAAYRAGVVAWPLGRWSAMFDDSRFYP